MGEKYNENPVYHLLRTHLLSICPDATVSDKLLQDVQWHTK